jgi:hypothetical protein
VKLPTVAPLVTVISPTTNPVTSSENVAVTVNGALVAGVAGVARATVGAVPS